MVLEPLASQDQFTDQTGVTLDETNSRRIDALLTRASSAVRGATQQTISRVVDDVYVIPYRGQLLLPQRPADTPSSITINGQALTGFTLIGQKIVGPSTAWPWMGWSNQLPMIVTYSHGYETNSIPDEIVGLVCDLAERGLQNPDGYRSETVGNWTGTYASETLGPLRLSDDERKAARRALGMPATGTMSLL